MDRKPKTFLGRAVLKPHISKIYPKHRSFSWIIFIAGPLAVAGSWAYLSLQPQSLPAPRAISASQTTIVLADTSPVVDPNAARDAKTYCTTDYIKKNFNPQNIFPILPPQVLGYSATTAKAPDTTTIDPTTNSFYHKIVTTGPTVLPQEDCSPAYWNRNILWVISWKILGLIYWAAGIIAVVITIYAGLLFISGFASEENTKTAKKLLTACYTGLAIIIFGRIIIYGTIQPFIGDDLNSGAVPVPTDLLQETNNQTVPK